VTASIGSMRPTATSVCVYCSSSEAIDPTYRPVGAALGAAIAAQGWNLVYGGGNVGLMGEVARAAMAGGAHVTGVIPRRLAGRELALESISELIYTDTMRERKTLMDERSDAFIVLPGGIGTLEELVEIVTLKQLGYHDRAVVILDAAGFWDPLLAQLERMIAEGFAHGWLPELWQTAADPDAAIAAVRDYAPPPARTVGPVGLEVVEDTGR
jgi:uncharacterized protein (TIGR00730 family)